LNFFLNSCPLTIISSARLKKNRNINFFREFFIYLSGLVFDLIIIFLLKIKLKIIAVTFD